MSNVSEASDTSGLKRYFELVSDLPDGVRDNVWGKWSVGTFVNVSRVCREMHRIVWEDRMFGHFVMKPLIRREIECHKGNGESEVEDENLEKYNFIKDDAELRELYKTLVAQKHEQKGSGCGVALNWIYHRGLWVPQASYVALRLLK